MSERAALAGGESIGRALNGLRLELRALAGELETLVEPSSRPLVGETVRLLDKQVFKIAVIGQIKSGKSTFINAFAQSPDFLPTDVNPWTTAVTRLHFKAPEGHLGAASDTGEAPARARFTFFTENEWQRLSEGGGRLRELTQRLVPGFEPELLRQQVDALKRRAADRLGPDFANLLGQSHAFARVDRPLLDKYVCAGSGQLLAADPFGPEEVASGQFSDITKSADIRCEDGPFDFPVTVVDTPGTNDPFLLRDEITRRNLEDADLHIVVLTARQPLSRADLALLRILRGLHKDRIVVFVNRIDDLSEIGEDASEVRRFVADRIAAEFPGANIPIVMGSARWANAALASRLDDLRSVLEPQTVRHLTASGLARHDSVQSVIEHRGDAGHGHLDAKLTSVRKAMRAASGIPAVYQAVAMALHESHCAHVVRQVALCHREMAQGSLTGLQATRDHLEKRYEAASGMAAKAGEEMRRLQTEIDQLQQVSQIITRSNENIERQLGSIVGDEMRDLRTALEKEVADHARHERRVVIDTLTRGRGPREWHCEAIELRRRLAAIFNARYQNASGRVADLLHRVTPELRQLTQMIAGENAASQDLAWQQIKVETPSLAPLSTFIALDLEPSWWQAWMTRRPTPDERGAEVHDLIVSEFSQVIDELLGSAEKCLADYCETARRWSFGVCTNIVEALASRREQLRASYENIAAAVDGTADEQTISVHNEHMNEVRQRLRAAQEVEARLSRIWGELSAIVSSDSEAEPVGRRA